MTLIVVWMVDASAALLREKLGSANSRYRVSSVASLKDFLKTTRDSNAVAFVDRSAVDALATSNHQPTVPVVAVCDQRFSAAVSWFEAHGWLSHVVSAQMLQHPLSVELLENVISTLQRKSEPRLLDWMSNVAGRRVLLTQASNRTDRLERMTEFLGSKGVTPRIVHQIRDVAEELITNAFYDAPVAAGAVKQAIPRTQDVSLPEDDACDLIYGCSDDLVLVRVKDPFGALTRSRIVEVLSRCAHADMKVQVDETMGGAGLGLWRVFSVASFVAVSVVSNRHTEFLVGITRHKAPGLFPFAAHLFFTEATRRRFWQMWDTDSKDISIGQSVAIAILKK